MHVVDIWTGRHANALQKAMRLTNEDFALQELGVAVRTVAKWHANPDVEPTTELQRALDTSLSNASEAEKARFTLLLEEASGDRPQMPQSQVTSPNDIESLASGLTATSVTDDAVTELSQAVESLAESHTKAPAGRVLKEALRLHERTQGLLEKQMRLRQRRELYKAEASLLAHACLLFGDLKQDSIADRYGLTALAFAQEAETNPAIALSARAKNLRWQERFIESANVARHGYECSPATPIRIQLASQEANAAALLGDSTRAREALRRAESAAETVSQDSGRSAWSFAKGRQALFALAVATELGDADVALQAVEAADAGWAAGEPCIPANWAQIRVGAGLAHLMVGSLDGTIEEVTPMLSLAPELRVATVTDYVSKLDRRLASPKFHNTRQVDDLRQQLHEFNKAALSDDMPRSESE
ncbi:hypothetical protein [Spirillospora sp. NPDC047279]|uniref:hypothetical protein n=1 Tax=Spirillospora sp. NPDC047279 TaxID=3155478 RepID=UPI0033F0613D